MAEMTEAAKAARREYKRQWAKANPDKVRETARRYWEKKALQKSTPSPNTPPPTEKAPSA